MNKDQDKKIIKPAQIFEGIILLYIISRYKHISEDPATNIDAELYSIRRFIKSKQKQFSQDELQAMYDVLEDNNDTESLKWQPSNTDTALNYITILNQAKDRSKNEFLKYIDTSKLTIGSYNNINNFFYNNSLDLQKQKLNNGIAPETAIKKLIHDMSKTGLQYIDYKSGTRRNIDVYVRQLVEYNNKRMTNDIKDKYAELENITIWEFDAHPNARPAHQLWQGKRYDETGKYYPTHKQLNNFEDETDYNCRHIRFPVHNHNDKYMFTEKELKNINTPDFEFAGKTYTGYEATQYARRLEREIRALKREKLLLQNNNFSTNEIQAKIKNKNKQYNSFMRTFGTYPRSERLIVEF